MFNFREGGKGLERREGRREGMRACGTRFDGSCEGRSCSEGQYVPC